jgi:hypothetical protein
MSKSFGKPDQDPPMMSQDFDKQLIWLKYFSWILAVSLNTQGGASPKRALGLECRQPHCGSRLP